ncbi:MAG TPA: right-handed parallel beta-helix repeat-containing protein, partial [Candidatus Absconditabacterales bacterium]|nr:right-handed parallel beta-helix repeat-containing protein [Candidatus Absconditabacterales bacterium]
TTGNNGSTGYYKGTVDIRSDVSDNVGISGATCEYTIGGSRNTASYSGTSTTGYCYKTNIVGGSDLAINFRVKDTSNNIGIGISNNYLYDNIAPSYTFSSSSGYECVTGLLQILGANDLGIGLHTIPYSFDQFNWDTNTSLTILPQQPGIVTKTGYVRDIFGNQSIQTTTYTFKNSPITSNPFTINTSVVNNTVTGNWKILSNSSDLRCGSGDISFSGIVTQGIKGMCSVIGDIISYTPSINKTGSDSCTIQIKDNENSIANVVATWTGIDTMNGNIYYVSYSSGNDSNNGISQSTPWKTINKVNLQTFLPGDTILFKRGDTWTNETIIINGVGTSTGAITYGAYGTGEKPKISGFTPISGWTNEGSGVYSKNITGQSIPNMVTVNNINTPIGRWPNIDSVNSGWLTFESHSGNTSITDNELLSTPNWSGAEVVIRKHHWIIDRMVITNHSGTTITYTGGSSYNGIDGYGYFIQNDIKTLDQVGERSYTSGKFYMYFGANNPNTYSVKVSTIDRLFSIISKNYIKIQDISFEGANDASIFLQTSNNINITGCDIDFGGFDGIRVRNVSNLSISHSTINNTHNNALDVDTYGGSSTGTYFGYNRVSNNSLHPGMGGNGDGNGFAVSAQSDNSITEYNIIENVGYIGIAAVGEGYIVRNNLVKDFCLVKDDGSGIYTYLHVDSPKPSTTRNIENNIVMNGVGNVHGTTTTHGYANGIYMDGYSEKVIISGNTVIGSTQAGLFLGWQSKDIDIYNNTFFNNKDQILIQRTLDVPANYTFNNNILINANSKQRLINIVTNSIDSYTIDKLGTWDNNHYINQRSDDAIAEVAYKISGKQYSVGYSFDRWKNDIDADANNNMSIIPKYIVNSTTGSNKFANRNFDANISYTTYSYNPGTNSGSLIRTWDNTNKIDGGSLKFDYDILSNYSNSAIIQLNVGSIKANTDYIARFSTLGTNANRTLRVRINNNVSPYPILTPEPYYTITNNRTDYEIPLHTSGAASSANFYIMLSDIDGPIYLDNFELYEANVTITDPDDYMLFVYNTGSTNKTVPLSGIYSDIYGNIHSSNITIAPYASSILISSTEIPDYIPNTFSFVDVIGAEVNT